MEKISVCFGGYCPMHQGHLDVIMRAKKETDRCFIVVCGYRYSTTTIIFFAKFAKFKRLSYFLKRTTLDHPKKPWVYTRVELVYCCLIILHSTKIGKSFEYQTNSLNFW